MTDTAVLGADLDAVAAHLPGIAIGLRARTLSPARLHTFGALLILRPIYQDQQATFRRRERETTRRKPPEPGGTETADLNECAKPLVAETVDLPDTEVIALGATSRSSQSANNATRMRHSTPRAPTSPAAEIALHRRPEPAEDSPPR